MENNICYSGGAEGADLAWGNEAKNNGHDVIHYMFYGHKGSKHADAVIIKPEELGEADDILAKANKVLKRSWPAHSEFVCNLLRRNYWQVRDTGSLYAVAGIDGNSVFGGTAWAVEMFKILYPSSDKLYVYDQSSSQWFQWNFVGWSTIDNPPKPEGKWTGIGSRDLKENGKEAIINVFNCT